MRQNRENSASAAFQTGYIKNGIDVLFAPFGDEPLGIALQIDVNGKPAKTVAVSGKLRRTERRKVIDLLIYAIESGRLSKDKQLDSDALTAILTRKGYDKFKGGSK